MRRSAVGMLLVFLCCAALADDEGIVAEVRELRLKGQLHAAQSLAEDRITATDSAPRLVFELQLELARIHDRFGLHHDARPVATALEAIIAAEEISLQLDKAASAEVQLAYANYYYRAEMAERQFDMASRHARLAILLFRKLGDKHREAEAIHRLGLIHLQRNELDQAHELFDESLRADVEGGARDFFRGEYERHVGFIYWLREQFEEALPYFERSLEYRLKAGAIDASLFAAVSLASTLVELGRDAEALPHLEYALQIADQIDSPAGRRRAEAVLARLTPE